MIFRNVKNFLRSVEKFCPVTGAWVFYSNLIKFRLNDYISRTILQTLSLCLKSTKTSIPQNEKPLFEYRNFLSLQLNLFNNSVN